MVAVASGRPKQESRRATSLGGKASAKSATQKETMTAAAGQPTLKIAL